MLMIFIAFCAHHYLLYFFMVGIDQVGGKITATMMNGTIIVLGPTHA
jgi:hypothetical protein